MSRLLRVAPKPIRYTDGGEGFIKWCEDFVCIKLFLNGMAYWCSMGNMPKEVNPLTGRSVHDMWEMQKGVVRECLRMVNGRFVYRLIVLCWMRGEGKSFLVCLIQLWKFFNFPSQQIMLGANSKDQVKFVHFDIMRDIILNSPKLIVIVGHRNVQEKEIKLKNKGNTVSIIRSISSFSGIVSNITGYTFSEIFDMKNPKFFTQLDGSIRNIPNAMGVIDSTVSAKDHILYGLFDAWKKGTDSTLFFSHRQSVKASYKDFTHPEMTQAQLDSYRGKFPTREFAMYFKNTWDSGGMKMFDEATVEALHYIGWGTSLGEFDKVKRVLSAYYGKLEEDKGQIDPMCKEVKALGLLIPVSNVYKLSTEHNNPRRITLDELEDLSNVFDTNWALCAGVDRADPMKIDITKGAKTIIALVAKGLPGSRSNPEIALKVTEHNYFYFLVDLKHVIMNDMETIKGTLEEYVEDYDGIESLCTERWGMWDMETWCEEKEVDFIPVTASYTVQKEGFSEFFAIMNSGRLKTPRIVVPGVKSNNILKEELLIFDHDSVKKFYGSPEKKDSLGVQDDSVFSLNWAIYGGRFLTVEDMRVRKVQASLGYYYEDKSTLVGAYK